MTAAHENCTHPHHGVAIRGAFGDQDGPIDKVNFQCFCGWHTTAGPYKETRAAFDAHLGEIRRKTLCELCAEKTIAESELSGWVKAIAIVGVRCADVIIDGACPGCGAVTELVMTIQDEETE